MHHNRPNECRTCLGKHGAPSEFVASRAEEQLHLAKTTLLTDSLRRALQGLLVEKPSWSDSAESQEGEATTPSPQKLSFSPRAALLSVTKRTIALPRREADSEKASKTRPKLTSKHSFPKNKEKTRKIATPASRSISSLAASLQPNIALV